jgi:TorA maturation chaperone TorD
MDRAGSLQDVQGSATTAPGFLNGRAAGVRTQPDEVDLARAAEYALLGSLLLRAPDAAGLRRLAQIRGDATPIGLAHIALAEAAASTTVDKVQREFFELFIGVGRGELLPYASYYLTGFLNDRPLVRLRDDLRAIGIERAAGVYEPEDHIGTLCEVMCGLAAREFGAGDEQASFFARHISAWAARFFTDLEVARRRGFLPNGWRARPFVHGYRGRSFCNAGMTLALRRGDRRDVDAGPGPEGDRSAQLPSRGRRRFGRGGCCRG